MKVGNHIHIAAVFLQLTFNSAESGEFECPVALAGAVRVDLSDGSFFIGPSEEAPGNGCQWLPDGSYYEGWFENGQFSQSGRFVWKSGDSVQQIYEGEFRNGRPEGRGILTNQLNGSIYRGRFIDGEFAYGDVKIVYGTNSGYEGEFMDGQRDGKGVLTDGDSNRWEGYWSNDVLERGRGTEIISNQRRYTGTYVNGKPDGVGTIVTLDELYNYTGSVTDGLPHNQGTLIVYSDRQKIYFDQYIGLFSGGYFHGDGYLDVSHRSLPDRQKGHGPFESDNNTGVINREEPYIVSFVGEFLKGDLPKGQIIFSNGVIYDGYMQAFVPDGQGEVRYPNGEIKKYNFINGLPDNW